MMSAPPSGRADSGRARRALGPRTQRPGARHPPHPQRDGVALLADALGLAGEQQTALATALSVPDALSAPPTALPALAGSRAPLRPRAG